MKCAICGGVGRSGKTTLSVDTGDRVIVLRKVPATICAQCGEEWLSDAVAEKVERVVSRSKKDHAQFEVLAMAST